MNVRRAALTVALALLMAAPLAADAQQARKVPRLGILGAGAFPERIDAFRQALRALGYVEGKDIVIELRSGPGERLDALAQELVRLNVDLIVTDSAPATQAAKLATATIPIVFGATADPIGSRFVKSLAHPGGNITGFTEITPELTGKRLQLLKEALPRLTTLAVLGNPGHAFHQSMLRGVEDAAKQLGLRTHALEARTRDEIERAFTAIAKGRFDAVLTLPHPLFGTQRAFMAGLALKHHLPMAVTSREMVEAGGLLAYAPDYTDQFRRAAIYVDKILKGAKPADLPVEQPTKFELVINVKTAKVLGLTIPPSLLLRADQVIK